MQRIGTLLVPGARGPGAASGSEVESRDPAEARSPGARLAGELGMEGVAAKARDVLERR